MATVLPGAKTYNSFSGIDIKAVFGSRVATPIQAISYAIQREKAPIYTMGYPNPRAFSRGKRGIAGTLIFAMFDKHELVAPTGPSGSGIFVGADNKFFADIEEMKPDYSGTSSSGVGLDNASLTTAGTATATPGQESDSLTDQVAASPWYVDQIPEFDITLQASTEQGINITMSIIGVELVNEGYGVSIDDLVSEMQFTYVAREIIPWRRLKDNTISSTGSGLGPSIQVG